MKHVLGIASLCLLAASTLASSGAPSGGAPVCDNTTFSVERNGVVLIGERINGTLCVARYVAFADHPPVIGHVQFGSINMTGDPTDAHIPAPGQSVNQTLPPVPLPKLSNPLPITPDNIRGMTYDELMHACSAAQGNGPAHLTVGNTTITATGPHAHDDIYGIAQAVL